MAVAASLEMEKALLRIGETVRTVDPDVRDVVLIGSVVYAPELAKDFDLVVTTESNRMQDELKDELWDALEQTTGRTVDLILRRPGEEIRGLAKAILAGVVLMGSPETLWEARLFFEQGGGVVSAFAEAQAYLTVAEGTLKNAESVKVVELRYAYYGTAALTFLGRDDTRWGGLKRELPPPYGEEFKV